MKRILALVYLVLFSFACTPEQAKEKAKIDEYFDLEGTLDLVVDDLLATGASLQKKITVDGQTETTIFELATEADWKRQFELFYEADINKVGMSGAYQMESLQAFDGIEKHIYSAVKGSAFVKSIECAYRDGKLFTIRIIASEKNFVYGTNKEYILYFNHFNKKLRLDHYAIKSDEQMLLKGGLNVEVIAEVILP